MATLDLTLSKMRFPGIENFNPEFGTKETTGRGVHSVNLSENDMMPFLWQRPLSVVENSTTGNIEGDRKLAIEAASVTLTLGRPAYAGCKIDVYGSFQSGTSTVSYDKDASNTATITVGAGEHIELVANASRYFEPKAPALAEVVAASGTLSQAKTIPLGYTAESRLAFKVVFPAGHNDATSSDGLTLNGIPVVSNQNGTLTPIPHHAMDDGNGGTVYKVLDANTVLELYYTADYDGNSHPAFVIVGNPLVLSSSSYAIYANGWNDTDEYSTSEVKTNKIWIDGKPIYRRTFEVYKNNVLNGWTRSGHVFIYQGNDLSIDELISNSAITSNSILTSWASGTDGFDYPYGIIHFISGSNHAWDMINASNAQFSGTKCILTIEYTKTTD